MPNYVIWQRPNPPLIVWFIAAAAARLVKHGFWHGFFAIVSFAAIIIWALLEVFFGVNVFRRALGAAVLALTLGSNI